jgi:hypothetical protein
MRMVSVALGAGLVLCNVVAFCAAAQAQTEVVREPRERRITRVPIITAPAPPPYWDSYIVPRYRYRPEDDRVDPCGGPVVPVIRYGSQEAYVAPWLAAQLGLGRIHGRDWPCRVQSR